MTVKGFLKENVQQQETLKIIVSKRFIDENKKVIPFKIKGINEAQIARIEELCTKRGYKNGVPYEKLDTVAYNLKLVTACTEKPNFKDAALQESWGANSAEDLAAKMLLAGEFLKLDAAVKKVCGFNLNFEGLKKQVKN